MAKININDNPSGLQALADSYISKGKMFKALRILGRMPDSYEKSAMRAEILADAELINQSNREAYRALAFLQREIVDRSDESKYSYDELGRIYDVLIQNAFVTGSTHVVSYYGQMEYSELIEQMKEDEEEARSNAFLSMYKIVSPKDERYVSQNTSEGDRYFAMGQVESAYECYQEALKVNPDDAELHNIMGFIALITEKTELAQSHIEKALGMGSRSINALANAVLLYNTIGDIKKKEYYADLLDKADTDEPVKLFKIAAAFFESGYHDRAKKWMKKHLSQRPNLEIMILYAQACFNCGETDEAKEVLLDISAADPEYQAAEYYLDRFIKMEKNGEPEIEYMPFVPPEAEEDVLNSIIELAPEEIMSIERDRLIWAALKLEDRDSIIRFCDKIASADMEKAGEIIRDLLIREEAGEAEQAVFAEKAMEYGIWGPCRYVKEKLMHTAQLPLLTGKKNRLPRRIYSMTVFDFYTADVTIEKIKKEYERISHVNKEVWLEAGADEDMICGVILAEVIKDERYAAKKFNISAKSLSAVRKAVKQCLKNDQIHQKAEDNA